MWIQASENEYKSARPKTERKTSFGLEHLEVRMFRLSEGEAILIVFPGNTAWLVDGGNTNSESPNVALANALQEHLESRQLTLHRSDRQFR